jgi:hypothetical protein
VYEAARREGRFREDSGEGNVRTKDIDAEKILRITESVVLRKVVRDRSETLAIAQFDSLQGYVEERDSVVDKL